MLKLLKGYINLISDEEIRQDVIFLLSFPEVQVAFSKGSTYAGSNHPEDENKPYGLLLHTLRVTNVAVQLGRSGDTTSPDFYNTIIASAILHDVPYKFKENGYTNMQHAEDNALWYATNSKLTGEKKIAILTCILHHMGKWDTYGTTDKMKYSITPEATIVHLADNLASRKNIIVNVDCLDYLRSNLD